MSATSKKSKWVSLCMLVFAVLLSTGCAQLQLGQPAASMDNIQKARSFAMQPAAVGTFAAAKSLPSGANVSVNLRSNSVSSPVGGTFSAYLRETLIAELKTAGVYDETSKLVIEGDLTQSILDAPIGTGKGVVAARFRVLKEGAVSYDKELTESGQWESPFIGMVAIPAAMGEYTTLHRKLVGRLLDDPDFRRAVAK